MAASATSRIAAKPAKGKKRGRPKKNKGLDGPFRNRITEVRHMRASDLLKNKKNWRFHPDAQRSALTGILEKIGIVGALLGRDTKDGVELINGHLRQDLDPQQFWTVLITDLSDAEVDMVLATHDPLASLAVTDDNALSDLLKELAVEDNAEIRHLLAALQDDLVKEEKRGVDQDVEVSGMELAPHEHYDYLVVLCRTTQQWNVLCDKLDLKPMRRRKSMGTARAIKADDLLPLLQAKKK
ncbi:MAG: hypothetical protein GC190_19155 [Alphaproteobacteria bacterium]|nr:hypothetical protein [Alphaproteobacteria bacterium]